MNQRRKSTAIVLALAATAFVLPGCLTRRITVTSNPAGATVWLNDAEVGRTPLSTDFTYYGDYDVRVKLEGYEPINQRMTAEIPLHEVPPFDLIAEAVPSKIDHEVKWHFDLVAALETSMPREQYEKELLERATDLSTKVERAAEK
ncbi:MAG: PEGA domain-containing protein [Phycisphaerae bacterium]|nr:PEGA domain-containing protein [Phycisphaerae bacterium]